MAQVREDQSRKTCPVETPLGRGDRCRLHHAGLVACSHHFAEQTLEIDRLRCVQRGLTNVVAHAPLDTAQQRGPSVRDLEDRREQESRRRLTARPRNCENVELARRIPEECDSRLGHCGAGARDDHLRDVDRKPTFHHERNRTGLDRIVCEVVAVDTCARDAEEEHSGSHPAGVVRELADLDGSAPPHDLGRAERGGEPLQLHLASGV